MAEALGDKFDLDMTMRLAADRVLRAMTLKRQAKVALLASAALSVVAVVQPDLLPPDLLVLKDLLNVGAISGLLKKVAEGGEKMTDEAIAAEMEGLLPDRLDDLVTGQKDLLRALTRQHTWQQQMLRLQEEDQEASARLLAGFAEMTGDLAAIRESLAEVATAAQVEALTRLIEERVMRLSPLPPFTPAPLPPLDEHGRPPLPDPAPLPPGSRMAYDRNPLFIGREDELRELARLLLYAPAGVPAVISTGIGGLGKTQLAVEFAGRYGRFFHGVHWVSLAAADAVPSEAAACGQAMELHPGFGALSLADKVELTRRAWAGPEPRLIIFDNCEDWSLLEEWRPVGGGARALVTSRDDTWPAGYTRVPLPTLPRADSRALLREYLHAVGREETDAALDKVAVTLDDLPLALTLAGSVLAAYPSLTVALYLTDLDQPDLLQRLLPEKDALPKDWTRHDQDVARTFAVSYGRLRWKEDETDAAARVLLVGSTCLVHGEPFPRALLMGMLPDDDPRPAERAVNRLLALGLLERSGAAGLRLHRLLALFVAQIVRPLGDETMAAARAAVEGEISSLAYRQNEAGDPRALREWEIHLRHVTDAAIDREDEAAATLCTNLGYYLQMSGDLAGARPYHERALAIRERVLGLEHPNTALSLNNMGGLLQARGDLAEARPYYERALAIRERVLGPEHPATAASLNNMGGLLQAMGDLAGARPYLELALTISERVLGPEQPTAAQQAVTATSLNNMGYLLKAGGDLAGARPYYERALAISERVLGPEHPQTAAAVANLGELLYLMGDLAEARPHLERALAISERVLGLEHPDTASNLNNLGTLLRAMGDPAEARLYYERALAIYERVLGPEHPDTATSLNNMGYLLQAMGDLAGARPYYERALAVWERVLGLEHPKIATAVNNLGMLLYSMGDLAGARPYLERSLAIRERVLGSKHPQTAAAVNNLGTLLHSMSDLAGAQPYYEQALAIRERVLGPEHHDTAQSLNNLGLLLQATGDLAGARPYLERALAIWERVLGPEHHQTAAAVNNLGTLLHSMGDLARARPYLERTLAIRERVLGPEHHQTAAAVNNLGTLLHSMGDLAGARPYYERALAIFEAKLGPDHPQTRIVRDNLARVS